MGILHHLGLVDAHKGIFKGMEFFDTIKTLLDNNSRPYKVIASALLRYSQGIYSDETLELFKTHDGAPKLFKQVGTSQYTDGVRIDKDFHNIFNPPTSQFYTKRGTAREIKVLFNNKVFEAEYRFENQQDKTRDLQSIRFRKELKQEFHKVFPIPEGEFIIQQGQDLNHFVFYSYI